MHIYIPNYVNRVVQTRGFRKDAQGRRTEYRYQACVQITLEYCQITFYKNNHCISVNC